MSAAVIEHKLLWCTRGKPEMELVLKECERVASEGGRFQIQHRYTDDWYSFITIYYPES